MNGYKGDNRNKWIHRIGLSVSGLALIMGMVCSRETLTVRAASEDNGAICEEDFLKAKGKNLHDQSGNGQVVNLRGVNAGGYLLQECWLTPTAETNDVRAESDIYKILEMRFGQEKMYELLGIYQDNYWTEEDFGRVAELGANCIRLPFWYRNLVDETGAFYPNAFERMDDFVETAGEYGLYVILDFHGAPGSQSGSDHSGVDGKNFKEKASEFFFGKNAEANQELFYTIWEEIAAHYEGNPVVAGYDLLNEPYCSYRYNSSHSEDELHSLLWQVYDQAYDRIRAIDEDHVIIMEAVWDPWDLPKPKDYGWENIMYEYHNYLYDDYDNAGGGQIKNMENKLKNIAKSNYNVPCYMGEFSYFSKAQTWDEGLELLNQYGINWTMWSYKSVSEYGNWGLYHHPSSLGEIDLMTASYEEIKEFWGRMDECVSNESLCQVVKKYCNYPTQEYNLSLWKLFLRKLQGLFD